MNKKRIVLLGIAAILLLVVGLLLTQPSGAGKYPPNIQTIVKLKKMTPGPAGVVVNKLRYWTIMRQHRQAMKQNSYLCSAAANKIYDAKRFMKRTRPNWAMARVKLNAAIQAAYACRARDFNVQSYKLNSPALRAAPEQYWTITSSDYITDDVLLYSIYGDLDSIEDISIFTVDCNLKSAGTWQQYWNGHISLFEDGGGAEVRSDGDAARWRNVNDRPFNIYIRTSEVQPRIAGELWINDFRQSIDVPACARLNLPFVEVN